MTEHELIRHSMPEWIVDEWWASGVGSAISRDQLIEAWQARTPTPKPEKKTYVAELKAWSGLLAVRRWVRDTYGVVVRELADDIDTKEPIPADDGWLAVSRLYWEHGDPLARVTAGMFVQAHARRPAGLPRKMSDRFREKARSVPVLKARELLSGREDSVIVDAESAGVFLDGGDPQRMEAVRGAAMREYARALLDQLAKELTLDEAELGDASQAIRDAVGATVRGIESDFGEVAAPTRVATEDERREIRDLLDEKLISSPQLTAPSSEKAMYVGEGWRRAFEYLLKRKVAGHVVDNANILFVKIADAERDDKRAQRRLNSTGLLIGADDDTDVSSVEAATYGDNFDRVERRHVIGTLRGALKVFPMSVSPEDTRDCWEKTFALGLLDNPTSFAAAGISLRQAVASEWAGGRPPLARCTNVAAAVRDVQATMFAALTEVVEKTDTVENLGDLGVDVDSLTASAPNAPTYQDVSGAVNLLFYAARRGADVNQIQMESDI